MVQIKSKYIRFNWAFIGLIIVLFNLLSIKLYSAETDSTVRQAIINIIVDGVDKMNNTQYDSAIVLFEKADSLSVYYSFLKLQASCQYNIGVTYYRIGDYVHCGDYFDRALTLISNTDDSLAMAQYHLGIGILHKKKGDFQKATGYVLNAVKILEKSDNTRQIASAYNTLAGIQNKMQNDSLALDYYNQALSYYQNINDTGGVASIYNNIGNFYLERNQYNRASKYLKQSLRIKEKIKKIYSLVITANALGKLYNDSDNLDSANYYYNLALFYSQKVPNDINLIEVYHEKSRLFLKWALFDSAYHYTLLARPIILENNIQDLLLTNYELLSLVYEKQGQYKKSLENARIYDSLNKKILSKDLAQNINDLQFQYETDKKDLAIENLNTINQIKTESIKTRNFSLLIISFLLLGSIILMILLYKAYQQKSTAHKRIQFLMHEKQHRTKNNLQLLSSVLSLQSLHSQKEEKDISREVENRVQSIVLLDRILYETNIEGDEIDLSLYINELILGIKEAYTLNEELEIKTNLVHLMIAAEQAKFIGLLVNEIITNSFKYAFNNTPNPQLDISILPRKADLYRLIIRDNGPGLPEGYTTKNKNSLGMKLIDTMSRQLKGDYLIDNREGFYFHLEFKIKKGLY